MFALLLFVLSSSFIYYLFLLQSHNTTTIISSSSSSSSPITGDDEWETISIQPTVVVVGQQQHNNEEQQHDDDDISSSSLNQTNKNNHQYNNNNNNKRKSRWVKTHHHYHRSSSSNNNNNNNNTTTTTSSTTIISKNKNSNNNNNNIIHVGKDDIIMGKGNSHDAAIVIDKYKLIFFTIQKCGGTVWKQLFRRIQGYDNWRTGETWGSKLGVKQLNDMSTSEATKIMNDPNWIKAMMVRDPKERLVSSYLDKAIQTNYFYNHCCRSKSKSYVTICPITNKDEYISFDTFVTVTEYCHDKHWMPQSTKMEIKYIQLLDFIGHIETAYDDAKELLESIGIDAWEQYGMLGWGKYSNESIFQSTSYVEHKTSTSSYESKSRLAKYYTPELEKIVEERYKNDYNIKQFDLQLTKIEY